MAFIKQLTKRNKDFSIYTEVTDLFIKIFPNSTTPQQMSYSPMKYIENTVACVHNEKVLGGFKKSVCRDTGYMSIDFLAVGSEHRNKGIGTRLLSKAEKLALEMGSKGVVVAPRRDSIGFYQANGYEFSDISSGVRHMEKRFN